MKLEPSLTRYNANQNLLNMKFAIEGPILQRAEQIKRELEKGVPKPFKLVVRADVGDSHALGQKPITFIRQVLSSAVSSHLMNTLNVPDDVVQRAQQILDECNEGSVGSYSPVLGLNIVRSHVAQYIEARDGVPSSPEDIYLGSGSSEIIKSVLTMFVEDVNGKPPAVMTPIPQFPLYSATLTELGLHQAPYYLDEECEWSVSVEELERCWTKSSVHNYVRAIVIINPGNPTGQVLSRENIQQIIKFAYKHNLFLMADEVYQENTVGKQFHSFKKVMHEMGAPYSTMELASFMTCSKGWSGECGLRSGYVELVRVEPSVIAAFTVARSTVQCPSVLGQCTLDCVMKPPRPGEPSYKQFAEELNEIRQTFSERTKTAHEAFNSIPGLSCNNINNAMFAFPRLELPARALSAAEDIGMYPDEFYCLRMLEETGICVVPGVVFGQRPGTYHFRITIIHSREEFRYMLDSIKRFHLSFLQQYS